MKHSPVTIYNILCKKIRISELAFIKKKLLFTDLCEKFFFLATMHSFNIRDEHKMNLS